MNRHSILYVFLFLLVACREDISSVKTVTVQPDIFPDYKSVTIPSTIAPLNFQFRGDCEAMDAVIEGKNQETIHVRGTGTIKIPPGKWARLLEENTGDSIRFTLTVRQNGKWTRYSPFLVYVSNDPIDYSLAYRLIAPGYEVYSKMGIYQRELSTFKQKAILKNTLLPGSCINCHSFRQSDPGQVSLHIRGKNGGTLLMSDGKMKLLNTKTEQTISNFVYPYWHPSGNYIAYSVNKTQQAFHSVNDERVEVLDLASDVLVYDIDHNQAVSCQKLMQDSVYETFPSFSPDGKTLYFCSAEIKKLPDDYQKIRYNLCSISFNPATGTFGNCTDTLFNAAGIEKSVTFPRPSPDGKYIMFTLTNYGNFSVWHKEADLYLLDLQTSKIVPMDNVNSPETESYHSWSSNSRWIVFSSRRTDGLYTRPFLAHIGADGKTGKPFLLPQENPDFYINLMESFNIPEFVNGKIDINIRQLEKKALQRETEQVNFKKL